MWSLNEESLPIYDELSKIPDVKEKIDLLSFDIVVSEKKFKETIFARMNCSRATTFRVYLMCSGPLGDISDDPLEKPKRNCLCEKTIAQDQEPLSGIEAWKSNVAER